MTTRKTKQRAANAALTIFLLTVSIIVLSPLLLALLNSFKTLSEITYDVAALPETWQTANYERAWNSLNFPRALFNSLLVTVLSNAGVVLISSMAAYRIVRYFLVRILGKYAGAWLGCRLVKKDKLVRNYLGLALIPQAGVAIGLAALGARTLGGTMGSDLQTIILASSVLYELIGPGCAKLALYLSRSYSTRLEDVAAVEEVTETGERKSDVQLLIERIQKIQSELPALDNDISEEEAAFTEAAEEQLAQTQAQRRFFYLRR